MSRSSLPANPWIVARAFVSSEKILRPTKARLTSVRYAHVRKNHFCSRIGLRPTRRPLNGSLLKVWIFCGYLAFKGSHQHIHDAAVWQMLAPKRLKVAKRETNATKRCQRRTRSDQKSTQMERNRHKDHQKALAAKGKKNIEKLGCQVCILRSMLAHNLSNRLSNIH